MNTRPTGDWTTWFCVFLMGLTAIIYALGATYYAHKYDSRRFPVRNPHVWVVDGTYSSVTNAIKRAKDGDVVQIRPGFYFWDNHFVATSNMVDEHGIKGAPTANGPGFTDTGSSNRLVTPIVLEWTSDGSNWHMLGIVWDAGVTNMPVPNGCRFIRVAP